MTDIESAFIVLIRSDAVGEGRVAGAVDDQTLWLLRALNAKCPGARVFRGTHEAVFDSFGDDMGHHPGHDIPFTLTENPDPVRRVAHELIGLLADAPEGDDEELALEMLAAFGGVSGGVSYADRAIRVARRFIDEARAEGRCEAQP